MGPYQQTPKLVELLDTRVKGSVQWVLLEISWTVCFNKKHEMRMLCRDPTSETLLTFYSDRLASEGSRSTGLEFHQLAQKNDIMM